MDGQGVEVDVAPLLDEARRAEMLVPQTVRQLFLAELLRGEVRRGNPCAPTPDHGP